MLAKPRWPMNASEGSHFFLISSHFSSAESVMTCKFVSYRDAGFLRRSCKLWPMGGSYLGNPVLRVEVCHIHAARHLFSFLVSVK